MQQHRRSPPSRRRRRRWRTLRVGCTSVRRGSRRCFPDVGAAQRRRTCAALVPHRRRRVRRAPPGTRTVSVFQAADNVGHHRIRSARAAGRCQAARGLPRGDQRICRRQASQLQIAGIGAPAAHCAARAGRRRERERGGGRVGVRRRTAARCRARRRYDALPLDDVALRVPARQEAACESGSSPPATPTLSARCACCRACRLSSRPPRASARCSGSTPGVRPLRAERTAGVRRRCSSVRARPLAAARSRRAARNRRGALGRVASAAVGLSLRDVLVELRCAIRAGDGRAQVLARDARPARAADPGRARRPALGGGRFRAGGLELPAAGELSGLPVQRDRLADARAACRSQRGSGQVQLPVARAQVLDLDGREVATRAVPGATLFDAPAAGLLHRARAGSSACAWRSTCSIRTSRRSTPAGSRTAPRARVRRSTARASAATIRGLLLLLIAALLLAAGVVDVQPAGHGMSSGTLRLTLSVEALWPLWLLALLPLIWWASVRTRSSLGRRQLAVATVLRSAALGVRACWR